MSGNRVRQQMSGTDGSGLGAKRLLGDRHVAIPLFGKVIVPESQQQQPTVRVDTTAMDTDVDLDSTMPGLVQMDVAAPVVVRPKEVVLSRRQNRPTADVVYNKKAKYSFDLTGTVALAFNSFSVPKQCQFGPEIHYNLPELAGCTYNDDGKPRIIYLHEHNDMCRRFIGLFIADLTNALNTNQFQHPVVQELRMRGAVLNVGMTSDKPGRFVVVDVEVLIIVLRKLRAEAATGLHGNEKIRSSSLKKIEFPRMIRKLERFVESVNQWLLEELRQTKPDITMAQVCDSLERSRQTPMPWMKHVNAWFKSLPEGSTRSSIANINRSVQKKKEAVVVPVEEPDAMSSSSASQQQQQSRKRKRRSSHITVAAPVEELSLEQKQRALKDREAQLEQQRADLEVEKKKLKDEALAKIAKIREAAQVAAAKAKAEEKALMEEFCGGPEEEEPASKRVRSE